MGVLALRERRRPSSSAHGHASAGYCPASSTCPGTATPPPCGCAPRRSCARRSAARPSVKNAPPSATRRWPGCTWSCGPSAATGCPRWTRRLRARGQAGRRGPFDWVRPGRRGQLARLGEEQAGELLGRWARAIRDGSPTDETAAGAGWPISPGCAGALVQSGTPVALDSLGGRGLLRRGTRRGEPANRRTTGRTLFRRLTIYRTR